MNELHVFSDGTTMVIAKNEEDAIQILNTIPDYVISDFIEQFPDNQKVEVITTDLEINIPDGALYMGRMDEKSQQWQTSAIAWVLANKRGFLGWE